MYYVYAYIDPHGRKPFYIGKGKGKRAYQHLLPTYLKRQNTVFHKKLRSMLAKGTVPEVVILCANLNEEKALQAEETFIQTYGCRHEGGCLCNMIPGGTQPPSWRGKKHTPETRRKMSQVPRTEEWKRKIAESSKGRKASEESKQHQRDAWKSRMKPIEAFDLDTSQTLMSFEGRSAAERAGFNKGSINRVLKGVNSHHKGYGWRYAGTEVRK